MTKRDEPGRPTMLDELRRLIRLRWIVGLIIIAATATNALGTAWSVNHARIAAVGLAILAYNSPFFVLTRRGVSPRPGMTWGQLLPDLACLALLTAWTGGLGSPVLLAFFLYMVLVSLLLTPTTAYSVAGVAVGFVYAALWLGGSWPADRDAVLTLLTWTLTVLLTAYMVNRIARGVRARDAALHSEHSRTDAIVEAAADGIITIDEIGTVQSINPAAEGIFGYRADEVVGRNVSLLMPEPFHSEHDRYIANYLDTGKPRIIGIGREVTGRRKDGDVFPLDLAVSEVNTGTGRLFTGIVRDISDRKQAEAQLRELHDTLLRQQESLVQHEKLVTMGEMAAGVAHEIANPLANMDSLLQLVQRHPDRLDADTTGKLREQVARINRLVRQMKEFTHPGEDTRKTIPVNDLVEHALEMVALDHRTRHIEVRRDLAPDAGSVDITPQTIEQVVVNLVLNALDAVAGADHPAITVTTQAEPSGSVITVIDNGHGITAHNLSRIFEPFFTTKPVGCGTGLGLSISSGLVQRSRGRIEVDSNPGRTAFAVHLPREAPASGGRETTPGRHS